MIFCDFVASAVQIPKSGAWIKLFCPVHASQYVVFIVQPFIILIRTKLFFVYLRQLVF